MDDNVTTIASMRLRGRRGVLGAQLHWPAGRAVTPMLLVLFPADEDAGTALARRLCRPRSGPVVLVSWCRTGCDAVSTVEWAADHAARLGAVGSTVALVGEGRGGELAAAAAWQAACNGWPTIDPLALIDPPHPPAVADELGAQLLHRRGCVDVAAALVNLLEGTNR